MDKVSARNTNMFALFGLSCTRFAVTICPALLKVSQLELCLLEWPDIVGHTATREENHSLGISTNGIGGHLQWRFHFNELHSHRLQALSCHFCGLSCDILIICFSAKPAPIRDIKIIVQRVKIAIL